MRLRGGEGLPHLLADRRLRIVGQPLVLPPDVGELGLQEEIVPRHQTFRHRVRDSRAHTRLVIVFALVGGVDAAKPLPDRQKRQPPSLVFLPGGAIEKRGMFGSLSVHGALSIPNGGNCHPGTRDKRAISSLPGTAIAVSGTPSSLVGPCPYRAPALRPGNGLS